jgi:hypothetical protein
MRGWVISARRKMEVTGWEMKEAIMIREKGKCGQNNARTRDE